MIKPPLLFFLFCFISVYSFAQTNLRNIDSRSIGMGGNAVTNTALINPSCLCLSTSQRVDINYFNKYGLKELSSVSLLYANPRFHLPFAVHISSFGYNKYRESMFRLALSKQVSSKWILGVSLQYSFLQSELFEEVVKRISTDAGVLFLAGENLLIGLSITDLPSVRLDDKTVNNEAFNHHSVSTGFQWRFINTMLIALTAGYDSHTNLHFNLGMEHNFYDDFFIRAGVQTNPLVPSFGAGLRFSSFTIDAAAGYHHLLGFSPGLGLSVSF